MLKSPESIIMLTGGALSAAFGVAAARGSSLVGLTAARAGVNATLFGLWPVVAFVFYVKICGPRFVSGVLPALAMVAVALVPFWIVYT